MAFDEGVFQEMCFAVEMGSNSIKIVVYQHDHLQ